MGRASEVVCSAMFGDDPTDDQVVLSTLVAEAMLNLRTLAEWTACANTEERNRRDALAALPMQAWLELGFRKVR